MSMQKVAALHTASRHSTNKSIQTDSHCTLQSINIHISKAMVVLSSARYKVIKVPINAYYACNQTAIFLTLQMAIFRFPKLAFQGLHSSHYSNRNSSRQILIFFESETKETQCFWIIYAFLERLVES